MWFKVERAHVFLHRPKLALSPYVLYVASECIALTAHGYRPMSYGVADSNVVAKLMLVLVGQQP